MSNSVNVRVEFKGEMAKRFKKVKEKLGLENNTEVLRALINKEFSQLEKLQEA